MKNRRGMEPGQAARVLGSIVTEKKTASSRRNIQVATAARRAGRKPLAQVECTCGAGQVFERERHAGTCPLYQAIYYRQKSGLPLE